MGMHPSRLTRAERSGRVKCGPCQTTTSPTAASCTSVMWATSQGGAASVSQSCWAVAGSGRADGDRLRLGHIEVGQVCVTIQEILDHCRCLTGIGSDAGCELLVCLPHEMSKVAFDQRHIRIGKNRHV